MCVRSYSSFILCERETAVCTRTHTVTTFHITTGILEIKFENQSFTATTAHTIQHYDSFQILLIDN